MQEGGSIPFIDVSSTYLFLERNMFFIVRGLSTHLATGAPAWLIFEMLCSMKITRARHLSPFLYKAGTVLY